MATYYFKVEVGGFDGERLMKVEANNSDDAMIKIRKRIISEISIEETTPEKESCKKADCNDCVTDDPAVDNLMRMFGMKK